MNWLQKAMGLGTRWWITISHRIPLLQQVLNLIRDQRPVSGSQSRMPKNHKSLVPQEIRNKILWLQNDSRCATLALRDGDEGLHDFQWFVQQLQKDIQALEVDKDTDQQPDVVKQEPRVPAGPDVDELVHEALETLQEHPQCLSAIHMPSRVSFRLVRKCDKASQDFRVQDLKRTRAGATSLGTNEPVKREFDVAVAKALPFLESPG